MLPAGLTSWQISIDGPLDAWLKLLMLVQWLKKSHCPKLTSGDANFSTSSAISDSHLSCLTSHHILANNTTANTNPRRRITHVKLCWAFVKEANRTRIARNTFPETSVPFFSILNGAK